MIIITQSLDDAPGTSSNRLPLAAKISISRRVLIGKLLQNETHLKLISDEPRDLLSTSSRLIRSHNRNPSSLRILDRRRVNRAT